VKKIPGNPPTKPFKKGNAGPPKEAFTPIKAATSKKQIREILRQIREEDVHDAIDEVRTMLKHSTDPRMKMWAIEFIFKYGVGNVPRRPLTEPEEVPVEKEQLQKEIETLLARFALDGDMNAINAQLAALDPQKYGKRKEEEKNDDEQPRTVLVFGRGDDPKVPSIDEEEDYSDEEDEA
jgi:hypothetical protein